MPTKRARRPLEFVLIGAGQALIDCAETVLARCHRIMHVVARSPDCRNWAKAKGIAASDGGGRPLGLPVSDYIVSIANDRILGSSDLATARLGAFNCHNSLLPAYRGAFAASWALLDNRQRHGVSWHQMSSGIDDGPLAFQADFAILPEDTARSLNQRSLAYGVDLLKTALLPAMEAGMVPCRALPPAAYFPVKRRAPALGLLPWQQGATAALRHFRALDRGPIDNSFDLPKLIINRQVWLVRQAAVIDDCELAPGRARLVEAGTLRLGTACGGLLLQDLCRPTPFPPRRKLQRLTAERAEIVLAACAPEEAMELERLGQASAACEGRRVAAARAAAQSAIIRAVDPVAVGAGDWLAVAQYLRRCVPDDADGAVYVASPGLTPVDQSVAVRSCFHAALPIGIQAGCSAVELAEQLRALDGTIPALIDIADRRRQLLDIDAEQSAYISIKSDFDGKWKVSIQSNEN